MANRIKPFSSDEVTEEKKVNRASEISRKDDKIKTPSLGLMDIDHTIMYYFNNIINPEVIDAGERIKVPIRYASPERWASIQKDGIMRNERGKLLLPVIVFRRTSMTKDDTMPQSDLDGNLRYTFKPMYSEKFRYDKFSVLQGAKPPQEFHSIAFPDFQIINYDFIIYTDYIQQMNGILEKVSYSEGRYWGEPGKFRFKTTIDSFEDATDISTETDRIVKANFSISVRGYLIQKDFNYETLQKKDISVKKVVVKEGSRTLDLDDVF